MPAKFKVGDKVKTLEGCIGIITKINKNEEYEYSLNCGWMSGSGWKEDELVSHIEETSIINLIDQCVKEYNDLEIAMINISLKLREYMIKHNIDPNQVALQVKK